MSPRPPHSMLPKGFTRQPALPSTTSVQCPRVYPWLAHEAAHVLGVKVGVRYRVGRRVGVAVGARLGVGVKERGPGVGEIPGPRMRPTSSM